MKSSTPDPAWQRRVDTIDRLLPRLSGDAHERLQRERLALLRRIHNVPQMARLPLDWRP
jgi:hypothetical protein